MSAAPRCVGPTFVDEEDGSTFRMTEEGFMAILNLVLDAAKGLIRDYGEEEAGEILRQALQNPDASAERERIVVWLEENDRLGDAPADAVRLMLAMLSTGVGAAGAVA